MKIATKRWFGLLEFYIIVEKWRPWYATWNETANRGSRRVRIYIADRAFWEHCELLHVTE